MYTEYVPEHVCVKPCVRLYVCLALPASQKLPVYYCVGVSCVMLTSVTHDSVIKFIFGILAPALCGCGLFTV